MASAKSPDGRRSRWSKHNAVRRQVIIDAALSVIEAGEPGADVHVQQIADQAGMSRTVVYRHFGDRADLDGAVQEATLDQLWGALAPALTLDGTIDDIIRRIVSTYVGWALDHPALHTLAERDLPGDAGAGALQRALVQISRQVEELISVGAELLGIELDDDDADALDPLVFALVGAVFSAVRRWIRRNGPHRPETEIFVDRVAESVWHIIDGHARRIGFELDPHINVDELFAARVPAE